MPVVAEGGSLLPFASTLLELVARLRTASAQPDVPALRERTEAALRAFTARATEAGFAADLVRRAHYALCESLDDAVLNTPWGAAGAWARQPLVATFHPTIGPGRLFDALRQAESRPDTLRPVLEVIVVCLSLGTLGVYRGQPDGAAQVETLRSGAAQTLIASAPPVPAELAAEWVGVDAPHRPRRARLPVWVAASAALAVAAAVFFLFSLRLNTAGDALFARMLAAPPAAMPAVGREPVPPPPPPPPPPEPTVQDRLRARLADAVAAGDVVVAGTPGVPVVRLPERALFPVASATPDAQAAPLLQAVAAALRPEGGQLRVLGYSDDRPVRSVLFASAFKLSAARADAVRTLLARDLGPGTVIAAEGRAGADPVAPNTTSENRERNRRVEIVVEGARP